eukprot:8061162-Alexandrium_andersonii.AAC.1
MTLAKAHPSVGTHSSGTCTFKSQRAPARSRASSDGSASGSAAAGKASSECCARSPPKRRALPISS